MQPEDPAELAGNLHELMQMVIEGRSFFPDSNVQHKGAHHTNPETLEAEVVEPVEAGRQK